MYVLIVRRKGDVQLSVTSSDSEKLKIEAALLDGAELEWQSYLSSWGAHSIYDDEKLYSIFWAPSIDV